MEQETSLNGSAADLPISIGKSFLDKPVAHPLTGTYLCRFGLEPTPAPEWITTFSDVWANRFPDVTESAGADEHSIWISCLLDDVVHHYPKLQEAVELTNAAVKLSHEEQTAKARLEAAQAAAEEDKIQKIQDQLQALA